MVGALGGLEMGLQSLEVGAGVGATMASPYASSPWKAERRPRMPAASKPEDDEQNDWRARHDFFEEY